jgi:hypothetical protein
METTMNEQQAERLLAALESLAMSQKTIAENQSTLIDAIRDLREGVGILSCVIESVPYGGSQ